MAPMRPPIAALLLALAACGGGSEGANTADEESAGQPTVQQAVPENLTDDPRNEAIPLDPPPVSAPTAASTPASLSAFPASFRGRWGLVAADCTPGRADAMVVLAWEAVLESEPALLHGIVKTDRLVVFGGGVPLVADGRTVGAIGVSGGSSEQDVRVAEAGAAAVG